jgi:hypothetical protein
MIKNKEKNLVVKYFFLNLFVMNTIKTILILKITAILVVISLFSSCCKGGEPKPKSTSSSSNTSSVSIVEDVDFLSTLKSANTNSGVVGGDDKEDDDDNRGVPGKQK